MPSEPQWLKTARAEGRVLSERTVAPTLPAPAHDASESEFQAAVIRLARACEWKVYHTFDSRRSEEGFPDLVMVRGRRIVCAELKSSRGRTTAAQDAWLAAIRAAGPEVYLWRPADWTSIEVILERD